MEFDAINKLLDTLHRQSKEVGISDIYTIVSANCNIRSGKNIKKSTFQNKININREEHKLNIEEFVYILQALEQKNGAHLAVLQDLVSIFGFNLVSFSDTNHSHDIDYKSFISLWMGFNKEHGNVQEALTLALSDYKITTNELHVIKKQITEETKAMAKLLVALEHVCGKKLT